jgi:hypothetical protein
MSINWDIVLKIVMPLLTLFLGVWLKNIFEAKEKLIAHYGHVSSFKLKRSEGEEQDRWVYTHSVIVRNAGRKLATNLRLGHNVLPDNVIVQPDIEYSIKDLPGGSKELVFPSIAPKKEITISYLYSPPLTYAQINSHIESDSGAAKVVNVLLQQIYPKWINASVGVLMLTGSVTLIYLLVMLVAWLINM